MNLRTPLIVAGLGLTLVLMSTAAHGYDNLTMDPYQITISSKEGLYKIQEDVILHPSTAHPNISCWIPSNAHDIVFYVDGREISNYTIEGNKYNLDTSGFNFSGEIHLSISYILSGSTKKFSKDFIYPTLNLSIILDEEVLFNKVSLPEDGAIHIPLPSYVEETAVVSWYIAALLVLLFILIVVLVVYIIRKQKMESIKEKALKSKDVLETEKELLFELLKEIEKRYRAKKISDDTYHKLKGYYKQRTVEIMKNLEEMNSS